MVAWVVIDRRHHRQAGPFALPLSTPLFPLPHLSPLLPTRYGHSYTTAARQPLCNQSVTHSFHRDGGCTPRWLSPRDRDPYSLPATHLKFSLFKLLRTLLRFFAFFCTCQKLNSFLFNRFRTLWQKHPGWGVLLPRACPAGITASLRAIEKKLNYVTLDEGEMGRIFNSQVLDITPGAVVLEVNGSSQRIPNDCVWVFAGGEPTTAFLKKIGIGFGPLDLTSEGSKEVRELAVTHA